MQIKELYVLELSRKEAEALKILLGKYSDDKKRELGLDEQEIKMTSELYNELPYREDD